MGNFEKLVVLTVLFLSAIVLAVSLSEGDDDTSPENPITAAKTRLEEGSGGAGKPPVLDTNLESGAGGGKGAELDEETQTKDDGPVWVDGRLKILRDETGLSEAAFDDYRIYTTASSDTWAGLSERFYGSGRYVHHLRSANEELVSLGDGVQLLVPVYDFAQDAGLRKPFEPGTHPAGSPGAGAAPSGDDGGEKSAAPKGSGDFRTASVYEVQSGDNLWDIADKVYGAGHRWEEIYEANRDVLESPEWVQVGTKLQIPR